MANRDAFDAGMVVRREVLGDEYVANNMNNATDFTMPMQDLTTRYCWGEIWGRPGLSRPIRSLINIAMISALNRPHELRAHIRGALRNGCTSTDIQEVLLQVAVYCGIPAGMDGFRIAQEVLNEADPAKD